MARVQGTHHQQNGSRTHVSGWLVGLLSALLSSAHAERLPIRIYTTADGLAHDTINRIVRDARGYLWFCTPEGLSRFDGYQFTNYTIDDGLPSRIVTDVLETRHGLLWVATADGLCLFHPVPVTDASGRTRRFTVYRPNHRAGSQTILTLLEDRSGGIWCGTRGGLYRFEVVDGRGIFQEVEIGLTDQTPDSRIVEALVEDRTGALWIGTRIGLFRRGPDARAARYTEAHGLPYQGARSLLMDAQGRIWVGTGHGLCRLAADAGSGGPLVQRVYTEREGLPSTAINALFQSSTGTLWVGSALGLHRLDAPETDDRETFRTYTTAQGLVWSAVDALAEDRDGNLWVGSLAAMKIARNGFTAYTTADGLPVNSISAISESRAGELYIVGTDHSLSAFDGTRFTAIQPNVPMEAYKGFWGTGQIHFQDRDGEWWIPTEKGVYRFPKAHTLAQLAHLRPKAIYTKRDGLEYNTIFRLYEDRRGDVWIANQYDPFYGLNRWERATGILHNHTQDAGLPDLKTEWLVSAFGEDRAGQLWIGSLRRSGLARYRDGRFQVFSTDDGVPQGSIAQIYQDRQGRLWVASSSGGIARIEDPAAARPRFVAYTTQDGLSSNIVHCITEDAWGRLYLGTGRGVDRLEPATKRIRHYTVVDGLPTNEVGFCYRDRSGALWFGTYAGLSQLVPEPDPPAAPPAITIRGLRIAGQTYPVSDLGEVALRSQVLQPNQNSLQIDFAGLSFAPGEVLRYQHKLEGSDAHWSEPDTLRTVHLSGLAPRRYRFWVRAVTSDGLTSATPAVFSFTILRPVWQRWWFLTLAAIMLGALLYALYRYRLAHAIQLERVRTRIATDLHDDIGSYLSAMALLSDAVRQRIREAEPGTREMAGEIAETARRLADAMSDIVWSIDPRRDDLRNLLVRLRQYAARIFAAQGIAYTIQAPADEELTLTAEQRRHLYLVCKEAITNIVRHAGASSVTIAVTHADHHLTAEIRDDGRGLPRPSADGAATPPLSGNGLRNMQARAEQLGGELRVESAPGRGTCVRLTVPLR